MLIITVKENSNKIIVFFVTILFCLLVIPSSAPLSNEELSSLFLDENYSIILVSLPQFMHDPESWNTIYSGTPITTSSLKEPGIRKFIRQNSLNDKSISGIRKFIKQNELNGESIPEIAEAYNGIVYANNPEYAYSKIIFPKENYENMTETFRSLGFKVRDNIPLKPNLYYSRNAIGLPYIYQEPEGEEELTGLGSTIAIIDSGIDIEHDDFPAGKLIFWNDTTPEQEPCCVDDFSHGTHIASIAAGTGSASGDLYKGVAPDAKLKIWKVSVGAYYDVEWAAEAVWQAATEGADVISISLGTEATSDMCTGNYNGQYPEDLQNLYEAIMNAINNGITVVAAAGNTGLEPGTIEFPACIDDVIAVGSTLKKDYYNHFWSYSHTPVYSEIHYIVNITTENVIVASGNDSGSKNDWSGFHIVFEPTTWPAHIEVKVEGKDRFRDCWPKECNDECINWDPGEPVDGDEYWIWSNTFSSGPYIVVELFHQPFTNEWPCLELIGGWHHYYDNESRIIVNIFRTNTLTTEGLVVSDSSRGPAPQGIEKPDVTAPGEHICAARASSWTSNGCILSCGDDDYISCSGTSDATPHVAGMVALLKEAATLEESNPSVAEITEAVKKAYDKILGDNPDYDEGHGRINVTNAVNNITDCAFLPTYDTDPDDNPKVPGSCFDYSWTDDCCTATPNPDFCIGDSLYEYFDYYTKCLYNLPVDCESYEGSNYCSGTKIYKPEWGCSGNPGYCNNYAVPDSLVEDCALKSSEDSDEDMDYYSRGTCKDYTGCSGGTCTYKSYTDYCVIGCSGIPNPCSYYGGQTSCTNVGCMWNPAECDLDNDYRCCGDETSCDSTQWLEVNNCNSIGLVNCPGDCNNDCGTYTNPANCENKNHCDWNEGFCSGTPNPCPSYTSQSTCEEEGCEWYSQVALIEYYSSKTSCKYTSVNCESLGDYYCSYGRCNANEDGDNKSGGGGWSHPTFEQI